MRTFILFLAALLPALGMIVTSCSDGACARADSIMAEAEAMMEARPDSSLTLLQAISPGELKEERRKALHSLLLSQAYDKNWIDLTSDSVIDPAVRYFDRTDDLHRRALAHYYAGRVHYNAADYPRALIHLKDAEEAADSTDHILRGLIYRNLSFISARIYDQQTRAIYCKRSLEQFLKSGESKYFEYARIEYASALISLKQYDESYGLLKSAIASPDIQLNHSMLIDGLRNYAIANLGLKKYKQALECYSSILKKDSTCLEHVDYFNMISAHLALGQKSEATRIANHLESIDSTAPSHYFLLASNRDFEKAYNALQKEYLHLDSTYRSLTTKNIYELSHNLNVTRQESLRQSIRRQHNITIIISLISVCILCCGSIVYFMHTRNLKLSQEKLQLQIAELLTSLNSAKANASDLTSKIITLFENQFGDFDNICKAYYETPNNADSRISNILLNEIKKFHAGGERAKEIESMTNEYYNNLIARLRNDFPSLKPKDIYLYILLVAGFSPRTISLFLDTTIQNIYVWKSRLRKKIESGNTSHKDDFIHYIS